MARGPLAVLLLIAATAAVFSQVHRMEFVDWDDQDNVYGDARITHPSPAGVIDFWRQPHLRFYIPVTRTVWAGIASLAQAPPDRDGIDLDPRLFHLANLLLHLLNVLLVFAILRILIRSQWPAAAGAALFALHPVQVEPVVWVTGMKDLLGGFFSLIALREYLVYAVQTRDDPAARRLRLHYGLGLAAFALAVLSKQTTAVLPITAWALDHWVLRRPLRASVMAALGWVPVAAGAGAAAMMTQGGMPPPPAVWARLFVAGDALAFYLGKLVFPLGLACHYGRQPELVLSHWWGYVTWLIPAGLAAALWLMRARAPALVAAGVASAAGLLPVLGLLPFYNQDVCDRFMYPALLGPALALAWLAERFGSRAFAVACVAGLALLGVLSFRQSLHWQDTESLFRHALAVNPRSWVAHRGLGDELAERGFARQAYSHYIQALRVKPDDPSARDSLGNWYLHAGRPEQAIEQYRHSLRIDSGRAMTHFRLGTALKAAGRLDEAIDEYRQSLRLNPEAPWVHNNLATALHVQGELTEAIHHYREAIRLQPDDPLAHRNLARLLSEQGKTDEALGHLEQAERLSR